MQPEFGASAPPPKFDLPDLARASVELPDAEEEMVNSTDLSGLEEPPLAIPSNWASESFSELKVTDAVPPPGAQPNWGDLVPTSRSSSPPGLPPQTAKTTQELGIAPPSAFAKEERSLGFEIDVAEPEEHYETTLVQEEVDLDDAPSQVTQRLPSSRPPPPPGSIPIIRSTQPTGVADVARARALLGRLVEGSELSAAETQWVLRLLAFGLIETWGEQQMRDAVMRLGPPP